MHNAARYRLSNRYVIFPERRRQLQEDGTKMRTKLLRTSRKVTPRQVDVSQPGHMGDDPVGFEGKDEIRGHDSEPSPVRLGRRDTIEGIIQLGRLKPACIVAEPLHVR